MGVWIGGNFTAKVVWSMYELSRFNKVVTLSTFLCLKIIVYVGFADLFLNILSSIIIFLAENDINYLLLIARIWN